MQHTQSSVMERGGFGEEGLSCADSQMLPCQVVGPSGHLTKPAGGTLAVYTRCVPASSPVNLHVKVVANLRHVLRAGDDPHSFVYKAGPPSQATLEDAVMPACIHIPFTRVNVLERTRIPIQAPNRLDDVRGSTHAICGMLPHLQ